MIIALLVKSTHNAVYFNNQKKLAQSELCYLLDLDIGVITYTTIGNIDFVTYTTDIEPDTDTIKKLSRLSFCGGVFEYKDGLLRPFDYAPEYLLKENVLTILKYKGKTNTNFTQLMYNIGINNKNKRLKILDPLCGQGTTLFTAMRYGHDAVGIDISKSSIHAGFVFIRQYLKDNKIKHKADSHPLDYSNNRIGHRHIIKWGTEKTEYKNNPYDLTLIQADTFLGMQTLKKSSFDLIICDLPYLVQHKSKTKLADLLKVDEYKRLLKKDGYVVFSYNKTTLEQETLNSLFSDFEIIDVKDNFLHRVDNSVNRDIFMAKVIK